MDTIIPPTMEPSKGSAMMPTINPISPPMPPMINPIHPIVLIFIINDFTGKLNKLAESTIYFAHSIATIFVDH